MASDGEEQVVMACGPAEGVMLAYQCRGCGMESDDIEDFNVSTCWDCCERASWGDLCQLERHGECGNGDPDSAEFCPCPCHDEDFKTPTPATPPAGVGLDGAEVPPCLAPAPGESPRSAARGALPAGFPGLGRAAHPVPGIPPSTGAGCAPERGQEGPPSSEAPARSPRGVAPGETAAASPASPGDAAASQVPSPSQAPPTPQGGRDGEGLDPASGGRAASSLAGWGVFVDEVRLLAIGGEGSEWWALWSARQHSSRLTCLEMTLPGGSWHVACDCEEDAAMLRDLMTGRGLHPATVKVARLADCVAAIERRKARREAQARSMEQAHGAQMRLNAEKRNQRGRPWTAKRQPGYGAGGNRRMPEKPPGGAA